MRIALGIEYDGTAYNGWQRQRTGDGVQERIEAALSRVANETAPPQQPRLLSFEPPTQSTLVITTSSTL